jgi:membrane fusion protein, multidrug efflux system
MKLSRTALSLLTVLVIFLAVGAGVAYRMLLGDDGQGTTGRDLPDTEGVEVASAEQFSPTQAQPVRGVEVVQDTLWLTVVAAGEAEAYRRSEVSTRTSGVVQEIRVREGQIVRAGDLMVQLDTTEAAMNLVQARADLTTREVDFEVAMLGQGEILDPRDRETRERILRASTGLDNAEVALRRAEMELEWTRVRAPFTGRVANLKAVEGSFLSSGGEVLTLVQLDPIKVEVNVLEAEMAYLREGRRATIQFPAFPGERIEGRIETINPVVDPETRSSRVTVVLPNRDHRIRPGMYARVTLEAQSYPDRVLIPRGAVVERDRRQVVFMIRNPDEQGRGVSEWRYVTLGLRNDEFVEVVPHEDTSMLRPGEIVLVDGHHYLAHDWPVELVESVARAGGRPGR